MRLAYVDTSCLVSVAFGGPGHQEVAARLEMQDRLFSSNLLEAELRAALRREQVTEGGEQLLSWLTWVHPDRALSPEMNEALSHGYLRGADLWHLACALYLRSTFPRLRFLSADERQLEVAKRLELV